MCNQFSRFESMRLYGAGMKPKTGHSCCEYSGLFVSSITKEHHDRTCGYWYLVTTGSQSHTAFAERDHLIKWLEERGLSMVGELALAGTASTVKVDGAYRETSHMSYDVFYSLDGIPTRVMSNGDYTLGIIVQDDDDIANIHSLNVNLFGRVVFDHAESRRLFG